MSEPGQKVVLISGGSRGAGRAIVERCHREGHVVATYSRSRTPFLEALSDGDPERRAFFWEAVDATDAGAIKRFASSVVRTYGRIDALINNAGIGTEGVLPSMRLADIDACVDVNLKGALYLTWACARFMLRQTGGSIVNVSSVNAVRGHAGVAVYSATKAALDGLTRSLARELGPRNIRVNSIAPGYFESDMVGQMSEEAKARIVRRTPLGRLGTVEDVASVVMFLLSASVVHHWSNHRRGRRAHVLKQSFEADEIMEMIREEIGSILEEHGAPAKAVRAEDRLSADLALKSLDLARLVAALELSTGADPFQELVSITEVRTVGDLRDAYLRFFEGGSPDDAGELLAVKQRAASRKRDQDRSGGS